MPIDKKKVDSLLKEIEKLEENELSRTFGHYKTTHVTPPLSTLHNSLEPLKKKHLQSTEKQTYLELSHYFRLVMVSIDDPGIGLEIWLRGILPKLLKRNAINLEEWERITNIGDSDEIIQKELLVDWKSFYQEKIRRGKLEEDILRIINEGRARAQRKRDGKT
ncbi:MAG: hypothetical protein ACFFE8_06755 [Candidatus Heimdallarchaeota archaeon]